MGSCLQAVGGDSGTQVSFTLWFVCNKAGGEVEAGAPSAVGNSYGPGLQTTYITTTSIPLSRIQLCNHI